MYMCIPLRTGGGFKRYSIRARSRILLGVAQLHPTGKCLALKQLMRILTEAGVTSRADIILYTVTGDSTVRIFMPVLDSPDHLQLHASLDLHSFGISRGLELAPRICWLNREAVAAALNKDFERSLEGTPQEIEEEEARRSRLKHIVDEGWDLFALVSSDGTVIVRAITVCVLPFSITGTT